MTIALFVLSYFLIGLLSASANLRHELIRYPENAEPSNNDSYLAGQFFGWVVFWFPLIILEISEWVFKFVRFLVSKTI